MIFNETEEQEKAYLQQVLNIINDTINSTDKSVKEHIDTLQEYKDYLWSNKDIDPHEIRSMRESILNHFARGENVIDKRNRLSKILDIPYFGRIDFKENGSSGKKLPVYIGIHTFYDFKNKRNLIYDWRSPISGMFYDYESGEATYSSPSGEVHGEISLKRQYRIRKGKMEYMIESSVTVHDDILQKELCSNADDKMKNIVMTIQREQNRIIRNEDTPVLIIQGVAGSGKTSIALHRIAYLLYAQKGKISSKDILIISPNKVFADYISNVLPELGETTVPETSMEQILSTVLDNKYKYQNFFGQVSELLEKPAPDFIERIQYKASFEFVSRLDKFILHMENHYFRATDVKLTKYITIPAEFVGEQFKRFHRYPIRQRFETMTDYILEMMKIQYNLTVTTAEKNLLRKEIKNMFSGNNDLQIYKDFFEWAGKPEMFKMRKNRMLEYADMAWTSALAQQGSVDNLIYNYNDFYYEPDPEASPSPGTDVEVSLDLKGRDDYLGQTYHREMLFYRVAPSGGMGSSGYPSVEFISLFDKNTDLRYRLFMLKDLGYATTVGDTKYDDGIVLQYYRDVKIKMTQGFSYPELLLMRAEAYARNSRKTEALSDLNTLRKYRYDNTQGSTDLPNGAALTEDQLLEEILKERRRELPIATFQRVLDLKRLDRKSVV